MLEMTYYRRCRLLSLIHTHQMKLLSAQR